MILNGCTLYNQVAIKKQNFPINVVTTTYEYKLNLESLEKEINSKKIKDSKSINVQFKLSLFDRVNNNESVIDYNSFIKFYSFDFGDCIKIVSGTDTIDSHFYIAERNYSNSPISHVFFQFNIPQKFVSKKKPAFVLIKENIFLNTEEVHMYFNK